MKKTLLTWLSTIALVLVTHMAFAEPAATTPYYTTKHPSATAASRDPATDILIVNNISKGVREKISTVRMIVPNTPIDDLIYAGEFDHVKNDSWAGLTHIQLYSRAFGPAPFFDQYVYNHAVITVKWEYERYLVEIR